MKYEMEIMGIQPFNDVYYKNCMYNPLLTGIYYCKGNITPFLSNDLFTYIFDESSLSVKYVQKRLESDIIFDMGIKIDFNIDQTDYINSIKENIISNIPIFIPIDRYYWTNASYNQGMYKKIHMPHFFLIYGYNDNKKEFFIIDVDDNGAGCYKSSINYYELLDCYNSFCDFIDTSNNSLFKHNLKMFRLICIDTDNNFANINLHLKIFKENFFEHKNILVEDLENIRKNQYFLSKCNFEEIFRDTKLLQPDQRDPYIREIVNPFFGIERAKIVQVYQIYTLFGERNDIFEILKKILNNFTIEKGLLLKMLLTNKDYDKTLQGILDKLDQIYELEHLYFDALESILKKEEHD